MRSTMVLIRVALEGAARRSAPFNLVAIGVRDKARVRVVTRAASRARTRFCSF